MSNCGYFKIHKGKVTCTNPAHPEYSKLSSKDIAKHCDLCRYSCGGSMYPSQLKKVDLTKEEYDIVDKNGKVIG